jgi:hypothetical protein
MNKKLIVTLLIFIASILMISHYSNIGTFFGVFLLLWANNIALADQLKKGR